jgi:phosphoribosylformimino-5-aminoimidazole carboxamide ribotide isomerase
MLMGVNVDATARLGDVTGLCVIASGGVAGIKDIELLKEHEHYNIDGVVVGQALYTGNLDLRQAVELGHQPLRRRSAGIIPYRNTERGQEFLLLFNLFLSNGNSRAGACAPVRAIWNAPAVNLKKRRG